MSQSETQSEARDSTLQKAHTPTVHCYMPHSDAPSGLLGPYYGAKNASPSGVFIVSKEVVQFPHDDIYSVTLLAAVIVVVTQQLGRRNDSDTRILSFSS